MPLSPLNPWLQPVSVGGSTDQLQDSLGTSLMERKDISKGQNENPVYNCRLNGNFQPILPGVVNVLPVNF